MGHCNCLLCFTQPYSYARVGDPILETIPIANASKIVPPLTRARNTTTVPRWNRDTWLAFRDSIAEHMCVEYEQRQQRNQQ